MGARSCRHQPSLTTLDEAVEAAIAGAGYTKLLSSSPEFPLTGQVSRDPRWNCSTWPAPRGPGHDQQRLLVPPPAPVQSPDSSR